MKQKNKSTIFGIIIVILIFMALLYVTEKKQHRLPIAKETKGATKVLGSTMDNIIAVVARSTTIALCMYGLLCISSINKALNRFRARIIRVYVKEPTKKRIKRYKKNRNEQI